MRKKVLLNKVNVFFLLTSSLPNSRFIPGFVSRATNDLSIVVDHNGSLGNILFEILYSEVIKNSKCATCKKFPK